QNARQGLLPGRHLHPGDECGCGENRLVDVIGPVKGEGDRQQAAKGMADQYQWPTTFRASAGHDAVNIVEQRAQAGRVAALTSAVPMPAVVHGVDDGAAWRKP